MLAAGVPFMAKPETPPSLKLGIDLFSIRSQNWSPLQYLDYCAAQKAKVVHFSEIRFIGGLEESNLRKVRERAAELGIEIEIGMKSICPTSKMFDAKAGTADEQLSRMIDAAVTVGSKIVRAVLGSADDKVMGTLTSKQVELSNVDLTQQFTDLVIIQRGYQSSSQVISVANQMIQQLVDMRTGQSSGG